jgi:DNA-binding XRE family transcriptional regulator
MKELADLAGITTRVIYKIEKDPGYNAKRDTMRSIANALSLPASVLFFPEEEIEKRTMLSNMHKHTLQVLFEANMIAQPFVALVSGDSTETTSESSESVHRQPLRVVYHETTSNTGYNPSNDHSPSQESRTFHDSVPQSDLSAIGI